MAHLVETMAYVNATPWHGLGNPLTENQPLEIWLREAGMDWDILDNPVLYRSPEGLQSFTDNKVLFRSDTLAPLSVVSQRYQVVQPREVLEFYRDLVELGGFQLETAGVLKGGKKLWALARTGQDALLKGNDQVKAYLLLATACDGTLATTAQFTSVRVVCNNTLQMATENGSGAIKVPHSTKFDPAKVKQQLGLGVSTWQHFIADMRRLSERPVNPFEARRYMVEVLGDPALHFHEQPNIKVLNHVFGLYAGQGMGANLASANDTAWGLVNAVTQFVDHERRARSPDNRLDSAWFGIGSLIKQKALDEALKLAA
jgi:phage/plasmid-like protein (TIGR03299 family)